MVDERLATHLLKPYIRQSQRTIMLRILTEAGLPRAKIVTDEAFHRVLRFKTDHDRPKSPCAQHIQFVVIPVGLQICMNVVRASVHANESVR
jgi:hypothetical protein